MAAVGAVVIIQFTDKDGKTQKVQVNLPEGATNPQIVQPDVPAAVIPTGEPLSPLALVRKPAKIAGVESWSIETINPRGGAACCLSPDGHVLAMFSDDGVIRLWNIADQRLVRILLGHEEGARVVWAYQGYHFPSLFSGAATARRRAPTRKGC